MDTGHWICNIIPTDNIRLYGFVYEITNLQTNKKYIGKKQCMSVKKKQPLKGKKNKRHFAVETDWKTYTSSCNELNEDIQKIGKNNFSFVILRWCSNKAELAYWEAKIQLERDVLIKEEYYNGIINLRIPRFKPTFNV